MFRREFVGKLETHVVRSTTSLYRAVYEIMWKKCCRAGQATKDNLAHEQCMLDS